MAETVAQFSYNTAYNALCVVRSTNTSYERQEVLDVVLQCRLQHKIRCEILKEGSLDWQY